MKMNHDSFQRAFMPVQLDDETGKKLLLQAGEKNRTFRKKNCARAAAIVFCIIIAGGVGTAFSYAQTGMSPVKLFASMFDRHSQNAVSQMENGFVISGQTIVSGNVQVTLNDYFYDEEHQIILAEVTVSTIDQTDFYSEEEIQTNMDEETKELSEEEFNLDYKNTIISMFESDYSMTGNVDGEGPVHTEMENGHTFHQYSIIRGKDYSNETMGALICMWHGESMGDFFIEDSGQMRFCPLDASNISHCQRAEICGAYLNIVMLQMPAEDMKQNSIENSIPFEIMQITMSDGHIYQWEKEKTDWNNAEYGHMLTPEELAYWEEEDGIKKIFGGITVVENYDELSREITIDFPDFLNVDDITSVTLNGVEVLE